MVGAKGVNVVYLEHEGTKKSGYTWCQKTQWLIPEQAAWLANLAILQMEALWTVARWHYLGDQPSGVSLVTNDALDAVRDQFPRSGSVHSWRQFVAREQRVESEDG